MSNNETYFVKFESSIFCITGLAEARVAVKDEWESEGNGEARRKKWPKSFHMSLCAWWCSISTVRAKMMLKSPFSRCDADDRWIFK